MSIMPCGRCPPAWYLPVGVRGKFVQPPAVHQRIVRSQALTRRQAFIGYKALGTVQALYRESLQPQYGEDRQKNYYDITDSEAFLHDVISPDCFVIVPDRECTDYHGLIRFYYRMQP
jgi:hypothetical protein